MTLFPLHGFLRRSSPAFSAAEVEDVLTVARQFARVATVALGGSSVPLGEEAGELARLLEDPDAQFGGLHFPLGHDESRCVVSVYPASTVARAQPEVSFVLADPLPGLDSIERLLDFVGGLAGAIDAQIGGVFHPDQRRISMAEVGGHAETNIVAPGGAVSTDDELDGITEEQTRRLAAAIHPRRFDQASIPESVWWLNFLGRDALRHVGEATIYGVEWQRVVILDVGVLLQATADPPRLGDAHGLERLSEIAVALAVRELQRAGAVE